jgi:hypothetical protein
VRHVAADFAAVGADATIRLGCPESRVEVLILPARSVERLTSYLREGGVEDALRWAANGEVYLARCEDPDNPCDEVILRCPSPDRCAVIGHTLFDRCHVPTF